MFRKTQHVVTALALALGSPFWIGCSGDKDKDQAATAASLPALSQDDVAKLKPVPHQQLLATSEVQLAPNAAPDDGIAHPDCAADDIETDYSAEVLYPITVCTVLSGGIGVFTPGDATPTHKLDPSALSSEQQAAFSNPQTIYWCRQSKGPWQGQLSSEHGCAGTCNTQNRLTLTNTPNLVVFSWVGAITAHPTAFQFDGNPKMLGTVDFGRCHPENAKPSGAGHRGP